MTTRARVKPLASRRVMTAASTVEATLASHSTRLQNVEVTLAKIESEFGSLQGKMDQGFQALAGEFAKRDKTPWPTIIGAGTLLISVMSIIGILAYLPIKTEIAALTGAMDRATIQTDRRLEKVWEVTVPRTELDFRLRLYDQRFGDVQRQVDDIKRLLDYRQRRDARKTE